MRSSLIVAAALAIALPLHAQVQVDTAGAGALIDQAMNHSEVMANLQYLADAIGPRLTGSAAARKANDWTASKCQGYGLTATLEPWNFGVTWERGPIQVRLLEPFPRQITGHSWAWTAGTNGKTLVGTVMRINFSTPVFQALWMMLDSIARLS